MLNWSNFSRDILRGGIKFIKRMFIFRMKLREESRRKVREKFEKEEREEKMKEERIERNKKWRQKKEGLEKLDEDDEKELDDNEKRKLKNREWRLKRESPEGSIDEKETEKTKVRLVDLVMVQLQCVACLQEMSPPLTIEQCAGGHNICGQCVVQEDADVKVTKYLDTLLFLY